MSVTERAAELATEAHAGQLYNGAPYATHCAEVATLLRDYGYADLVAAGWLHDALEDTTLTRERIAAEVDERIATLVWACTGVGANRRERNACIAARLAEVPAAIPIKVADRIANVESCWRGWDARLFMYHREYRDFRAVVAGGVSTEMLVKLDRLMGWRS